MNLRQIFSVVFILSFFAMNGNINPESHIISIFLKPNRFFPNNQNLEVLIYKNVFILSGSNPASEIESIFAQNNWGGIWRNGIYNYQHYHSTAHEALGVYAGWADVQLGGPGNEYLRIEKGDLMILPAGTAHKRIESGDGFAVVGAYPDNQSWDMMYGKANELEGSILNIAEVPLPKSDPVFGESGNLFTYWK